VNFSGYIPLRRGLIEHTHDGRLTNDEALTLVWLIMLADKETGRGTINGPTLKTFLPGLTVDGAKRVLNSLQKKGYIYRDITPRSPIVYPYWVNGFIPSTGPNKLLQLDLSEVFESKDPSKVKYISTAPAPAPVTAPGTALDPALDTALDPAHYNDKDQKKDCDQREESSPIPVIEDGSTMSLSSDKLRLLETVSASEADTVGEGVAHDGDMVPSYPASEPMVGIGLRWSGGEGTFLDSNARSVPHERARHLIGTIGLDWRGSEFFRNGTTQVVPWKEALRLIAGGNEQRSAA
jgi:hypothetical protein